MTQIASIPAHARLLAQQLLRDIVDSGLEPGDRLGTENDLIDRYDQTRAVVRQALGALEQQGIVSRRQRLGTFIERHVDPREAARPFRGRIVVAIADDPHTVTPDSDLARYLHLHATLDTFNDLGFTTQVVSLRGDLPRDEQLFSAAMQHDDLEGVVFIGAPPKHELTRFVPNVPFAAADGCNGAAAITLLDDARPRIGLLTDHLLDRGHRDIAVICGNDLTARTFAHVVEGYRSAVEARGLTFRRQRVAMAYDGEPMVELAMQMLRESPRPTAMIADGPMLCHAALHAAAHLNLRIGKDLSLVARGQNVVHIPTDLKLTAYIPDYAELGRNIARAMQQIIDKQADAPLTIEQRGRFVEGNTVRNLSADG